MLAEVWCCQGKSFYYYFLHYFHFLSPEIRSAQSQLVHIITYCKKGSHHKRQACFIDIIIVAVLWEYIFRMGRLDIWQHVTLKVQTWVLHKNWSLFLFYIRKISLWTLTHRIRALFLFLFSALWNFKKLILKIYTSFLYMANFICNRKLKGKTEKYFLCLSRFGKATWSFLLSIYEARWDSLKSNKNNRTFQQSVASNFSQRNTNSKFNKRNEKLNIGKKVKITRVSSSISFRPSKDTLKKPKFYWNKNKNTTGKNINKNNHLYVQATSPSVSKILKIKESFSNMSSKKIEDIHKIINNSGKTKIRINMTIKGPSRWQIIVPIETDNISKFISLLEDHIVNINRVLRNIKSDILADFIYNNHRSLIITMNKVTS